MILVKTWVLAGPNRRVLSSIECIVIIADRYFSKVGDSLVKYEDDFLAYHEAKARCQMAYGASLVEFRNEREWTEVITANFSCLI